jgi:hypothetical protein
MRELPNGLESYPDCRSRGDIVKQQVQELNAKRASGELTDIPGTLLTLLKEPLTAWIPETHPQAILAAHRDVLFKDDDAFFEYTVSSVKGLFSKPLYRMLFKVLTPSVVVSGATKRFASFHTGAQLWMRRSETRENRQVYSLELCHPPALFALLQRKVFCGSFRVAAELAGAKDVRTGVVDMKPESTFYEVSWAK